MGLIENRPKERERLIEPLSFTFPFAPRTKKNHSRLAKNRKTGRTFILPSQPYTDLLALCRAHWLSSVRPPRPHFPLSTGLVTCRALFYRDRDSGDANGYYQALADILESLDILEDDSMIEHWDGSRRLLDYDHPRTEFTITPLR